MKKLKLKALELGVGEVLTRAELRNVWGGSGCGSGYVDPCKGRASTVTCRNEQGAYLGQNASVGCSAASYASACASFPGWSLYTSDCSCGG